MSAFPSRRRIFFLLPEPSSSAKVVNSSCAIHDALSNQPHSRQ